VFGSVTTTVGHFIKHLAGSEPRTHCRGGKAAVRALLKASAVLRSGAVDGVGSAPVWGGARASTLKKRSAGLGTAAWGRWMGARGPVVPVGVGWCSDGAGGRGWHGVEMTLENFTPRLAFIPMAHHYWLQGLNRQ